MKVLVTGATGFIGSGLCDLLAENGCRVVVLTRDPDHVLRESLRAEQTFGWPNPLRELPPAQAFAGVDGVVHLAGESVSGRWTRAKKRAIRESRVLGTRNLVDRIGQLDTKPKVFICASAIGYYGDRGDEVLTEDSKPQDDFLSRVCQAWEHEAACASDFGLRVVHLRSGIVLGPGGGALAALLLPFKLGLGGPLGSGWQWWSWVHRDDVAGLVQFALQNESIKGPLNVTAPQPVRQREFAKTLAHLLRRPALLPLPAFVLKLAVGQFSSELLYSKRVEPAKAQEVGYKFRFSQLVSALRATLTR